MIPRTSFWIMLGVTLTLWLVLLISILGTSTMGDLGRKAVESGVIK